MKLDIADLVRFARRALAERGFDADFGPEIDSEVAAQPASPAGTEGTVDLRGLLWSSIDNDDSRDLDQVEVAEQRPDGVIRILVGVADVDARVPAGSATDGRAARNTTSVYTGVAVFPMLPERLSTDLTSLNPEVDRLAVVAELDVDREGHVVASRVMRAWTHNHAKLDYETVSAWLEGRGPAPAALARVKGLEAQVRLQNEAALRLKARRHEQGALELESGEARPRREGDRIVDLEVPRKGRARELIEDFMIAANGAIATFLAARKRSSIARVVRTPERWPRIVALAAELGEELPETPDPRALADMLRRQREKSPEDFIDLSLAVVKLLGRGEYVLQAAGAPPVGHFGLAVQGYSHSTAPNRRYADLITQRLVKSALAGAPAAASDEAIAGVAARCNAMEREADKVERYMRKALAAFLLRDRVGEVFTGVVTGASSKGTYVRLKAPPAEGRVVQGERGLDVGDTVRVRLLGVEPEKGFIDFARIGR